jgi:cyclophilin family peptidyl-prolyl cis-trans isomerase/HEAT repeat protein
MVLCLVTLIAAFAGTPGRAQQLADLEWRREPPASFASFVADPDPRVRAAAARALGRLQTAESAAPLRILADDTNLGVREEVAFALGITPGSGPPIRQWLDRLPAGSTWGAPTPEDTIRAMLLESLGRMGGPEDVSRLTSALAKPGQTAVAAAHGLARFGRKGVEGTSNAVPALVAATGSLDPYTVEAAAYALRRITMKSASPADVERAAARAGTAPTAPGRAWLVNAAWAPSTLQARAKLFSTAMNDTTPLVRISALDQVKPDDLPATLVIPAVSDTDEGVRAAAIAALGRLHTPDALAALNAHQSADPAHEADLERARLAAGLATDVGLARNATLDPQVRAAFIESVRDVPALVALCGDDAVVVRSAAASTLVDQKLVVSEKDALGMLASTDLVVRQAAIDRLQAIEPRNDPPKDAPKETKPPKGKRSPPAATPKLSREAIATVLAALRVETDPDVLSTGYDLLAAHTLRWKGDLDVRDGLLHDTLLRGLGHPDAPVREATLRLERASGLTLGDVVRRNDIPYTDVSQARTVVGAVVVTTRGSFTIELLPDVAPLAVANFARLGASHFYDKLVFHRVVPGFVIQTGDPRGDGSGGPGYTLPDEVSPLDYRHGAVGMARSGPDSGGSQWFVTTSNQPHLTGDYTLFGYVTSGLTVVDAIERGDRILSVSIDRVEREP